MSCWELALLVAKERLKLSFDVKLSESEFIEFLNFQDAMFFI